MNQNNYCVIMAGGIGSRFWPLSRVEKPKQFIDILGVGRTLLQLTFDRFKPISEHENIFVVTNKIYVDEVHRQLPEIPKENILAEPARRNTAPCIAYAANKIKQKNPLANMVVTPADHLIVDIEEFRNIIRKGLAYTAVESNLLTIGITPERPETGYGYIQIAEQTQTSDIFKVKTFTEKPDLKMAKFFLDSGEFLWNSGIFIWSVKSILDAMNEFLFEVNELFDESSVYYTKDEEAFIEEVYRKTKNISIDYGVIEKAKNVRVLPATFGWSDLGTWRSLYENSEKQENGNVINGDNVVLFDTKNSIVSVPDGKLVVVHGLENAIIAESDNLLLISAFDREQKIKQIVTDIRIEKGDEFV